jgi:hypothetical protein
METEEVTCWGFASWSSWENKAHQNNYWRRVLLRRRKLISRVTFKSLRLPVRMPVLWNIEQKTAWRSKPAQRTSTLNLSLLNGTEKLKWYKSCIHKIIQIWRFTWEVLYGWCNPILWKVDGRSATPGNRLRSKIETKNTSIMPLR